MESVKKYSIQTIAIIVLSVLLAISVAVGGTMAWFADNDTATGTLTMGGPVNIDIYDQGATSETVKFALPANAEFAVPSSPVTMDTTVNIGATNIPVFLRAKITVQVSGSTDTTTVQNEFNNSLKTLANGKSWYLVDGYYYYLTAEASDDTGVLKEATGGTEVEFLVGTFTLPKTWTNEVASATVTFNLEVQAIQGLIYGTDGALDNTIADVATAFDEAFPGA